MKSNHENDEPTLILDGDAVNDKIHVNEGHNVQVDMEIDDDHVRSNNGIPESVLHEECMDMTYGNTTLTVHADNQQKEEGKDIGMT